jgi:hypothetical protein
MDATKTHDLKPGMVKKFYHPAVGTVDLEAVSEQTVKKLEGLGYLVKRDAGSQKKEKV